MSSRSAVLPLIVFFTGSFFACKARQGSSMASNAPNDENFQTGALPTQEIVNSVTEMSHQLSAIVAGEGADPKASGTFGLTGDRAPAEKEDSNTSQAIARLEKQFNQLKSTADQKTPGLLSEEIYDIQASLREFKHNAANRQRLADDFDKLVTDLLNYPKGETCTVRLRQTSSTPLYSWHSPPWDDKNQVIKASDAMLWSAGSLGLSTRENFPSYTWKDGADIPSYVLLSYSREDCKTDFFANPRDSLFLGEYVDSAGMTNRMFAITDYEGNWNIHINRYQLTLPFYRQALETGDPAAAYKATSLRIQALLQDALTTINAKYSTVDAGTRDSCLTATMNAQHGKFSYIMSHFYCQIKIDPERKCYTSQLLLNIRPQDAYEHCVAIGAFDRMDRNDLKNFRLVMFMPHAYSNFDQNISINRFYASKNEQRPAP